MPTYGSNPAKGLDPRTCTVCGSRFQPYRASQTTCGIACYRSTPEYKAKQAAHKAKPEVRERRNAARRLSGEHVSDTRRRQKNLVAAIKRYGINFGDYSLMLGAQDGKCALCGDVPNGVKAASRLHVDHDHETGKVRALLCTRCNQGIGFFRDDPRLLRLAADYIERHRADR